MVEADRSSMMLPAGLAAKNPVFVLKADNVESRGVQCIRRHSIVSIVSSRIWKRTAAG